MPAESAPRRVFILVMTYPTPSGKYNETVCTAGIDENGEWVRLYPVDYRYLPAGQRYHKYQWVTATLSKSNEPRKESHKVDVGSIVIGEAVKEWRDRRAIIDRVHHSTYLTLRALHQADKDAGRGWTSLGIIRPTRILDVTATPQEVRDWTPEELGKLDQNQMRIFGEQVRPLRKIPYIFRVRFECADSPEPHELMIEDWEIGALYNKCIWGGASEAEAVTKVRDKYLTQVFAADRDVRLILGTIQVFPTWLVIGVFWPPRLHEPGQQLLF